MVYFQTQIPLQGAIFTHEQPWVTTYHRGDPGLLVRAVPVDLYPMTLFQQGRLSESPIRLLVLNFSTCVGKF